MEGPHQQIKAGRFKVPWLMTSTRRSGIRKGDRVYIETKADQGTGRLTDGMVDEILTRSESHPHGIKVRLQDGKVGRVKRVGPAPASGPAAPEGDVASGEMAAGGAVIRRGFADLDQMEIPATEDAQNEFKEFYQYDPKLDGEADKQAREGMKKSVRERLAVAVCSFGNSREGGFVYLGVDSDGRVVGLERDLRFGGFSDYDDSFANGIRNALGDLISDRAFIVDKLRMKFREVGGKTVCLIQVLPSNQPVYLHAQREGAFYVRGPAPRAEKLTGPDQFRYIKGRFPDYG